MVANLTINKFQYPTKALPFLTLMLILLLSKTYEEREFEMLELYTYRDTKNSKLYIHNIIIKTFVSETVREERWVVGEWGPPFPAQFIRDARRRVRYSYKYLIFSFIYLFMQHLRSTWYAGVFHVREVMFYYKHNFTMAGHNDNK